MESIAQKVQRPLSVEEAAAYLQLSPSYIYRLIHEKRIPYFKPGKNRAARVYFKQEDLEAFVFRGRSSANFELVEKAEQILLSPRKRGKK